MNPGDHVILIDDNWESSPNKAFRYGRFTLPKNGVVYTVCDRSVHSQSGISHISLVELPIETKNPGGRVWFRKDRFRKLDKLTPEKILAIETRDFA
jgi:hypothetical protein